MGLSSEPWFKTANFNRINCNLSIQKDSVLATDFHGHGYKLKVIQVQTKTQIKNFVFAYEIN